MAQIGHNGGPEQTIFRNANRGENYTPILNDMLQDERLSYDHIGLLCFILSQPFDWLIIAKNLIRKGCKRDKLYKILAELTALGYIGFVDVRDDQNQFTGRKYWASDRPFPEKPDTGKPFPEKPETGIEKTSIKTTANRKTGHGPASGFPASGKTGHIQKNINNKINKLTNSELEGLNGSTHPIITSMAGWIWNETGRNFYGDNPVPDQETFFAARNTINTFARTYGGDCVKRAHAEMITREATGDLIAKPVRLFKGICERQHSSISKSKTSTASETIKKLTEGYN